jgi:hypothetical protein
MRKQSIWISLAAAIWLLGRLSGLCTAGVPWYDDPCYTNVTKKVGCLSSASIVININMSPNSVCVGNGLCATAYASTAIGQVEYLSQWIASTTNCPDTYFTNSVTPAILTNWWVVSGPGSFSASGEGLFTCFTPTNKGSGTITFYLQYTNSDCPAGTQTTSKSQSFTVTCPNMTVTSATPECGGKTGGHFEYCYDCGGGWYWSEDVTWTSKCIQAPIQTTHDPIAMSGGCTPDYVDITGSPTDILTLCGCTECTDERSQTIYVGPSVNQKACSYPNTQTISITATDSTLSHGSVVTSSYGVTTSCGW